MADFLDACRAAARIGGQQLEAYRGDFQTSEKGINDLVTDADLVRHAVNQALIRITRHTQLVYLTAMTADDRVRLRPPGAPGQSP